MNKEKFLINALRKNSRTKISKLARKIRTPVTTLHFLLKKLEKNSIRKHVSLIDFEKNGYNRFIVVINNDSPKLMKKIHSLTFVNNYYRTQEGLIVECVFRTNNDHSRFLNYLSDKRVKYKSHPILEVKKQEEMEV